MTFEEISKLITDQQVASLGFIDSEGNPSIRRVFCTWHKGIGVHLISTNTSSLHVQELMKNAKASLYFDNCETFEGVCMTGEAILHFDHEYKAMLWHEGDEKYYPNGVEDEDYCVIEFRALKGRFYHYDDKGDITKQDIEQFDKNAKYKDCLKAKPENA